MHGIVSYLNLFWLLQNTFSETELESAGLILLSLSLGANWTGRGWWLCWTLYQNAETIEQIPHSLVSQESVCKWLVEVLSEDFFFWSSICHHLWNEYSNIKVISILRWVILHSSSIVYLNLSVRCLETSLARRLQDFQTACGSKLLVRLLVLGKKKTHS